MINDNNGAGACGYNYSYGQFCFNRLPCGLCRLTNQMCPLVSNSSNLYSPDVVLTNCKAEAKNE